MDIFVDFTALFFFSIFLKKSEFLSLKNWVIKGENPTPGFRLFECFFSLKNSIVETQDNNHATLKLIEILLI
ncbi:hypothetical protein AVO40_18565 [Acinetobacter baumannii]|nr:hypothetical protein AVO40_18565 [Acinetobacter baumannii]